jgi:wyosine [tRNA(Phe)-imidazoG37] synthetase (radical SAM superfamily)
MHLSQREILIGKYGHAAYKPCYWTEQSLRTGGRRQCYKHDFGIKSHQCIQSTSFRGCNIACSFCWRDVEGRQHSFEHIDEPSEIASELIERQRALIEQSLPYCLDNYDNMIKIVHAFGALNGSALGVTEIAKKSGLSRMRVKDAINDLKNAGVILAKGGKLFSLRDDLASESRQSLDSAKSIVERLVASREDIVNAHIEAADPKHVAISYDGEPTQYTRLGELICEFRRRRISTFLVTNGTFPERIKLLKETGNLPTQLYVTMAAPDKETYIRVCSSVKPYFPVGRGHWENLNKTLDMLSSLDCRTVIRITSVRGVNMFNCEKYRERVLSANPCFLEVKGFSISGNAPRISERLGTTDLGHNDPSLLKNALKYAPTHEEMLEFARGISRDFEAFPLISQSELNRQVLMRVGWKNGSDVGIDFDCEI